MLATVVVRELAVCNGGPGLSADELSTRLGCPPAQIRNVLAGLVFREKTVTCDREGRYSLGDPTPLLLIR